MAIKTIVTYGYSGTGPYRPGFSEVYYYLGAASGTADAALNTAVVQMMNARTAMMGNNVTALLYRLSVPGVPRSTNTVFATPGPNQPSPLIQNAPISFGGSEIPNGAIKVTFKTAQAQLSLHYLSGLPDGLFQTNPVGPNWGAAGLAGFQAAWTVWQGIMLNGSWGANFLNRLPAGQPVNILYWVNNANAPFNLQLAVPSGAGRYVPAVGDVVHIRKVLMSTTGQARPLGRWKVRTVGVDASNNSLIELDQSSAFSAANIQQPGTIESVTFAYQPFTSFSNYLQTSRRRGIGPVRPRGRSRRPVRRQAS